MRKYIDKPMVEMEGIKGDYKPKPDTIVTFTGVKGTMDTAKEVGSVQGVEVFYKGEYIIKSPSMEFDFQKSLAYTTAPVDLQGKKFTMKGIGLNADTKDQVITVEKDVSGNIQEEKGKYTFTADKFVYLLKDNTYIFEGDVVVKGREDGHVLRQGAGALQPGRDGEDRRRRAAYGSYLKGLLLKVSGQYIILRKTR